MEVFWTKGYEATSLDDLCEATEFGIYSLYAAFGNKRDMLFKSSTSMASVARPELARYCSDRLSARRWPRCCASSSTKSFPGQVGGVVSWVIAQPSSRGRMRDAMARVRRSLLQNQETIRAALLQARSRGEIARISFDAFASFLRLKSSRASPRWQSNPRSGHARGYRCNDITVP